MTPHAKMTEQFLYTGMILNTNHVRKHIFDFNPIDRRRWIVSMSYKDKTPNKSLFVKDAKAEWRLSMDLNIHNSCELLIRSCGHNTNKALKKLNFPLYMSRLVYCDKLMVRNKPRAENMICSLALALSMSTVPIKHPKAFHIHPKCKTSLTSDNNNDARRIRKYY